jgi:hypothetical protein
MRAALVMALVLLGGCGKSDDKATIEIPDGTVEFEAGRIDMTTSEGRVVMGSTEMPEGCPIVLMDGATIVNSTHMSQPDGNVLFQLQVTTAAPLKDVAAFYEKMFNDQGVEVSRSEQADAENQIIMLTGAAEGVDASAMIMRERGATETNATITWSGKKK